MRKTKLVVSPYSNNFRKDLKHSQSLHGEMVTLIKKTFDEKYEDNLEYIGESNKSDTDFIFKKRDGSLIKFELKDDFKSMYTGNVAVEYGQTPESELLTWANHWDYIKDVEAGLEVPEKPTGISTTQSDIWVFRFRTNGELVTYGIEINKLKELTKKYKDIQGGTWGHIGGKKHTTSMSYLIPKYEIAKNGFLVDKRVNEVKYRDTTILSF